MTMSTNFSNAAMVPRSQRPNLPWSVERIVRQPNDCVHEIARMQA
jgi:hypothetical protein